VSTKAKGYSISFRPAWLYQEALKYGLSLDRPRNVSEVVCDFVRTGLSSAGWELPADGNRPRRVMLNPALAAALIEARAMEIDPVEVIRAKIAEQTSKPSA